MQLINGLPPGVQKKGNLPGSRWLYFTNRENIIFLHYKTWISVVNPEAEYCCPIQRGDSDSIARASYLLLMGTPRRHLSLADQEKLILQRWLGRL